MDAEKSLRRVEHYSLLLVALFLTCQDIVKCGTDSDCGLLDAPSGGTVTLVNGTTTFKSEAVYRCSVGYQHSGPSVVSCQENGEWSDDPPVCKIRDCGPLTLDDGTVTLTGNTVYGSVAGFSCDQGYNLKGKESRRCEANGNWSGSPTICVIKDCGNLGPPQNGSTRAIGESMYGAKVEFFCDPGFDLSGSAFLECLGTGRWSAEPPVCKIRDCGPLGAPENGGVDLSSGTKFSASALFSCDTGYILNGSSVLECIEIGVWNDTVPICVIADCSPLVAPPNGDVEITAGTTFGETAVYSCNEGYDLIGRSSLTCLANGLWDGVPPTCSINDCGTLLSPDNGLVDLTLGTTFDAEAYYSCNKGYDLVGSSTLICLSSGSWSDNPPTCFPKDCGPLSAPKNGSLELPEGTKFPAEAIFSCKEGYDLIGSSVVRCLESGMWSDREPVCSIKDCGDLSSPLNGKVDLPTGTTFGEEAVYSCADGYNLIGSSAIRCLSDGFWESDLPTCEAVDCRTPLSLKNGSVDTPLGTTYQKTAIYSCDTGFDLSGSSTVECLSSGQWSDGPPRCIPKDCGAPDDIEHGSVIIPLGTAIGESASYSCDMGYYLTGNQMRLCTTDGVWDGSTPNCAVYNCGQLDSPQNGVVIFLSTAYNAMATYECNFGYMLEGNSSRRCEDGGSWSGSDPSCLAIDCGSLTNPKNGRVDTSPGTRYQDTAAYTCLDGFQLLGTNVRECLLNGSWEGSAPSCVVIDCGELSSPSNGSVDTTAGTKFGQTATYFCDPGFRLTGNERRNCTHQGWNGNQPYCSIINCGPLDDIPFGQVISSDTTFKRIAAYSCNQGYMLSGNSSRVCEQAGSWSSVPPSCVPLDCGPLSHPLNGTVDTTPGTTFKKTAAYTCKAGFTLQGTNLRVCESNSQWSGTPPECLIKDCGPLEDPVNGKANTSHGTTFGQLATYSCEPGFSLRGSKIRACIDTGNWSGSVPTCTETECDAMTNPANGQVNITGTQFGQLAFFRCDSGYRLIGEAKLICDTGGQWNNAPPSCVLIDCGIPQAPDNGNVTVPTGTLLADMAQYKCSLGFTRIGPSARICTQNGTWSGEKPRCDTVDCRAPPSPRNGTVLFDATTYGERATYTCNTGYKLEGPQTVECRASGDWSGVSPNCTVVGCGSLTTPENGEVDTTGGTTPGSLARYSCLPGYDLVGPKRRVCVNGEWAGNPPTCQPVDCGEPKLPKNGTVDVSSGTTFKKRARYYCNIGFYIDGPSHQDCGEDGAWQGSPPICKMHDCGRPENPANGKINSLSSTVVGGTVRFSCDLGYEVIGTDTLVCTESGRWSDSVPVCTITDCGGLESPGDGSVSTNQQTTTFGQTATYTCNPGYDRVGPKNRMCQQDGTWSGKAPICKARDCGPLTRPAFGSVSTPDGTTYSQKATYACDVDGYSLVGSPFRVCQENRTWSGEKPVCTISDCGSPGTPENGNMANPMGTKHGAVATYTCNYGYRLVGPATRTCIDESWTGNQPTCRIKGCGKLQNPENGIVNALGTTYGSSALYTCLPGYNIQGPVNRTCLGNGSWADSPPVCIPKDCGDLSPPANGFVRMPQGTTFGKTAAYSCNTGYALIGTRVRVCLGGGVWSLSEPVCRIHDCGPLSNPDNGRVETPRGTLYGKVATYSCFTGYDLQGQGVVTCTRTGKWSGSATCSVKDCGFLPSLGNGKVDISSGTAYTNVAIYSCNTGYQLIGVSSRICQETGKWSGSQPECEIIDCQGLSHPANGVVSFPFGTTYGETVIYTCNPGYKLIGNDTRICEDTGAWTGETPTCVVKDCGDLFAPLHGSVTLTGTTYGSVATYSCDNSFEISGVINRQCLSDGEWSASQPVCVLQADLKSVFMALTLNASIDENLSDPVVQEAHQKLLETMLINFLKQEMGNSVKDVMVSSLWKGSLNVRFQVIMVASEQAAQQFGQTVRSLAYTPVGVMNNKTAMAIRITVNNGVVDLGSVGSDLLTCIGYTAANPCDQGYICVITDSTSVCVPDPATDCGKPSTPRNGQVDISEGTTYGKTATYFCNPGYSLNGDNTVLCQTDGSWSSQSPSCSPIDCGRPLSPANGWVVKYVSTTLGETVTYMCKQGYTISGWSDNTCLESGMWRNPTPICIATNCESLSSPAYGSITMGTSSLGQVATYRCQDGYTLIGTTTRVCQNTTTSWTGSAPICAIKNCGPLSNLAGGKFTLSSGTTYGSVATYSCVRAGYKLSGDDTRLCGVSGVWSGTDPECVPRDCGPLSDPFGGSVTLQGGTTVGATANFTCKPGFRRSGPEILNCTFSGRWSADQPTCLSKVSCPILTDPEKGKVAVRGRYQGAKAVYTCNAGFKLVGPAERTCLSNDSWSLKAPSCELIDCGSLSAPSQGSVNLTATTYGNTATFTCDSGYGLVGTEIVNCSDTGSWSDTSPSCFPNCPSLAAPRNGRIKSLTGGSAALTATFICNLGYRLVGGDQRVCSGGVWTGNSPVCEIIDCGPPVNITSGRVGSYNATIYGQMVTYSCLEGYNLQGTSSVVCQENSTWSVAPACTIVDCGPPASPEEGTVLLTSGTLYGHTAVYKCNSKFVREGPAIVTCLQTGNWSHNTTCQKIDCGTLTDPDNGHVNISSGTGFNSLAFYWCNVGYRIAGSTVRICRSVGWSGMAPVCALVDCGQPESISNGSISTAEGTTYGKEALYSCDYKLALIGVNSRTCLATGSWNGSQPSCIHVDCGPLESPSDGRVDTAAGTTYAEVALYTCEPGYYVDGNSRRQCQDTGSWTGITPVCKLHNCGNLKNPENGKVSYSNTTYGAVATYRCDPAFTISGQMTRKCGEDGKWSEAQPRCDSQRAFAMALGIGLGVGGFLIIVMIIILILIFMYKRRYRAMRRKPSYHSMADQAIPTWKYYELYVPDDMSVYPSEVEAKREKRSEPSHTNDDTSRRPSYAPSYAHVEKVGKQDYYVPYIDPESRPQSSLSKPQSSVSRRQGSDSRPQSSSQAL